jgi:hypothetical protein
MAFCTRCGSNLSGAFCTKCGTPAAGAAAPAQPQRRTSPVVWVLVILLVMFCLSIAGVIGTGAYVAHRLRRDPRVLARILQSHPDLEVIQNESSGLMLRNRRTGQRFSLSFDNARNGRFSLEAFDDEGHRGSVEVGGDARIPSWVPEYPGSTPEPVFSAQGESEEGAGEAGNFHFDTPDSTDDVLRFYEEAARRMQLTVSTVRVGEKVTLATAEDEHDRILKVIATRDGGHTSVHVTYGRKR